MKKRNLHNQKGMTFVSVMVSAAMITLLVAVSFSSMNRTIQPTEKASGGYAICRSEAQNILNTIRASGGKTKTYKVPINSASVNLSDGNWQEGEIFDNGTVNPNQDSSLGDSLSAIRWPNDPVLNWAGNISTNGASAYKGPHTIYSYMNTLAAVFFAYQDSGICGDDGMDISQIDVGNLLPGKDINGKQIVELYEANARIKIRPYRIDTGAATLAECNINLDTDWPRPYAEQEPPDTAPNRDTTGDIPVYPLVSLDNYNPNIGFEVQVFVDLDRGNVRQLASTDPEFECDKTERFSYDREPNLIAEPVITAANDQPTVTISYPEDKHLLGGTLLCKVSASIMANERQRATESVMSELEDYQPCDLITTACGQNLNTQISNDHNSVTYTWPSTAGGCNIRFSAVLIDSVGNVSRKPSMSRGTGGSGQVTRAGVSNSNSSSDPTNSYYSVDGAVYRDYGAALEASQLSGRPISPTGPPSNGRTADEQIRDINTIVSEAEDHAEAAKNTGEETSRINANNQDLSTSSSESIAAEGNSASLNGPIANAQANANEAQENANLAQASATAASNALTESIDVSQDHLGANPSSTATYVGAISTAAKAVADANAAAAAAQATADEAQRVLDQLNAEKEAREAEEEAERESESDSDSDTFGP